MSIDTAEILRSLYLAPKERAIKKQLGMLDVHCRRFIALSPFVVVASTSPALTMDASPRGGPPGFVRTPDERTLLIPDAPGNNRLDTLDNIIGTGKVGLLFMIPGVDETLRVNGDARLSDSTAYIDLFAGEKRRPKLVIEVTVIEAYLHCAKALLRSELWQVSSQIDRSALPTAGQMISEQTGIHVPAETREEMAARYAPDL